MPAGSFTTDINAIRERARQKMEEGPVTSSYGKNAEDVISVLNEVVTTEIECWMRYTRHAISATGIDRAQVAGEFTEHAESERGHAMRAPWLAWLAAYRDPDLTAEVYTRSGGDLRSVAQADGIV